MLIRRRMVEVIGTRRRRVGATSGSNASFATSCFLLMVWCTAEIFHRKPNPLSSENFERRILEVEGILTLMSSAVSVPSHEEGKGKPSRHYHPSFHCTTIIIFNDDGGLLHHSIFIINALSVEAAKTAQSTINNTEASTFSRIDDGWS